MYRCLLLQIAVLLMTASVLQGHINGYISVLLHYDIGAYSAIKSLIIRVWLNLPKASSITSSRLGVSSSPVKLVLCRWQMWSWNSSGVTRLINTPTSPGRGIKTLILNIPSAQTWAQHSTTHRQSRKSSPESNTGGISAHEHGTTFSVWSSYSKYDFMI